MNPRVLDEMEAHGDLAPHWRESFSAIDRAMFLPDEFWVTAGHGPPRRLDRHGDPARWTRWAHANRTLITKWGRDGVTASSLAPGVAARMLRHLDVEDGVNVLELGTGNGYGTALLSHRLGDKAVTSVEIDVALVRAARANLETAGYAPVLRHGDGLVGCVDRAPFDRMLATFAVSRIPAGWLARLCDGGVMVLPWRNRLGRRDHLLRLVMDGGRLSGELVATGVFPADRSGRGGPVVPRKLTGEAIADVTAVGPRWLTDDMDANVFIGTRLPDCQARVSGDRLLVWDDRGESWATVYGASGTGDWVVWQYGPRALWDEVEEAVFAFCDAGRPAAANWRVRVRAEGGLDWSLATEAVASVD